MKMGIHHFLYIDIGIYLAIIETFILAALSLSCRIPSLVKDKQGPRASLPPVLHIARRNLAVPTVDKTAYVRRN